MKFIYSFIGHILVHGLPLVQELECLILVHLIEFSMFLCLNCDGI